MSRQFIVAVLCWASLSLGCASVQSADQPRETKPLPVIAEDLARAENLWNALNLKDYSYSIRKGGVFGYDTVHVRVRDGKCVRARSWHGLLPAQRSCEGRTVPELFDAIRKELKEIVNRQRREATFDACYGFPASLTVEMGDDPPDQDWYYTIEEFRSSKRVRCAPNKSLQPTSSSSLGSSASPSLCTQEVKQRSDEPDE